MIIQILRRQLNAPNVALFEARSSLIIGVVVTGGLDTNSAERPSGNSLLDSSNDSGAAAKPNRDGSEKRCRGGPRRAKPGGEAVGTHRPVAADDELRPASAAGENQEAAVGGGDGVGWYGR